MSQISHMSRYRKNSWKLILATNLCPVGKDHLMTYSNLSHDELTVTESEQCEEWMYIARMVSPPQGNHLAGNIESEMQEMRSTFTNEQISSMASWLHNEKKNHICDNNATTPIDIAQLNDKQ